MNYLFNFNRKIADLFFVPVLMKTPLRPNHITALSLLSGLMTGYMMSKGSRSGLLCGAFFLQLSFILDNCDGSVARLKNMRSVSGKWFDLIADLIVDFSLWAGLAAGAVSQGESLLWAGGLFSAAAVGSLIHFGRVIQKRLRGETVYDGDPSLLVWVLAALLAPSQILFLGTLYVHLLWLMGLVSERLRLSD